MNKSENSIQKIITQKFEEWHKKYQEDVILSVEKNSEEQLTISFHHWETKFLRFLEEEFPTLSKNYKNSLSSNTPLAFLKSTKVNHIEEFLENWIEDAKNGRLNQYYVPSEKSIQINITGNVSNNNIVVGNNNTIIESANKENIDGYKK